MPASMVFPSPTSSASMQPPRGNDSRAKAAASTWCGLRSTRASESAEASRSVARPLRSDSSSARSRWWKRVSGAPSDGSMGAI
jgi:hypothetical protein